MQERRGGKPRRFFFFRCNDLSKAPEAGRAEATRLRTRS